MTHAMRTAPALFALAAVVLWEAAVRLTGVPSYLVPGPVAIVGAFLADPSTLLWSLLSTLAVTFAALIAAALLGVLLALAIAASRLLARGDPALGGGAAGHADRRHRAADHRLGRRSVRRAGRVRNDRRVLPGVRQHRRGPGRGAGASWSTCSGCTAPSRTQTLWLLRLPAALPFFLAGLRISGGLALVGAVVAEFVAGSGGFASGLAYRILEAGYRLEIPRMFAALVLLSLTGIALNLALGALARVVLRNR